MGKDMSNNDEDWQRAKNLAIFKLWMTDKEMEEAGPALCVVALIVIAVAVLALVCIG